jgi:ferredoxin
MEQESNKNSERATDQAIEEGLAALDMDQVAQVINSVLENETGPRFKAYVETCMHCGMCADACAYFLSNDRDPRYSPAGKVKRTIWEMISKKGKVSKEFLRRAVEIAHLECNVCKRCAMYCPFGIDIAYMMLLVVVFVINSKYLRCTFRIRLTAIPLP